MAALKARFGATLVCFGPHASTVPVAGSAYTFSYATFGEFIARAVAAKKVFVIHDNQDYSKGIADFVTAALKGKGVATVVR